MESLTELKVFFTVFATVFLAEIGDKTQLATFVYAADVQVSRWIIFAGSSLALVCAAGIAVLAGNWLAGVIPMNVLKTDAGAALIVIGLWTIFG